MFEWRFLEATGTLRTSRSHKVDRCRISRRRAANSERQLESIVSRTLLCVGQLFLRLFDHIVFHEMVCSCMIPHIRHDPKLQDFIICCFGRFRCSPVPGKVCNEMQRNAVGVTHCGTCWLTCWFLIGKDHAQWCGASSDPTCTSWQRWQWRTPVPPKRPTSWGRICNFEGLVGRREVTKL